MWSTIFITNITHRAILISIFESLDAISVDERMYSLSGVHLVIDR
jgi:hypothetical protein